ncbi:other/FunK1 protein kinase [Coprinopsis cinerea AmutBmut pab1-1]|nr:other/FunK1 protein kinase [Coprinopsis cinerea AmutBmut pab1-1]
MCKRGTSCPDDESEIQPPVESLDSKVAQCMDGEFVEVTFDEFASAYLPFHPRNEDVEATIGHMATGVSIRFGELIAPRDAGEDEDGFLPQLRAIFSSIEDGPAPAGRRRNSFKYRDCRTYSTGCTLGSSALIHAGLASSDLEPSNVAVVVKYRPRSTDELQASGVL